MMIPRADRLKEPPNVGRWYMVPAIFWYWRAPWGQSPIEGNRREWFPVWGLKHNDIEHFDFKHQHYHVDPRFLTKRLWRHFRGFLDEPLLRVQSMPMNDLTQPSGPPKPTLRRMRCSLAHSEWGHSEKGPVQALNITHAGQQCSKGKLGFVCPHRHFPLGSIQAIDGVITCPMHGLLIDAQTGKCLGLLPMPNNTRETA